MKNLLSAVVCLVMSLVLGCSTNTPSPATSLPVAPAALTATSGNTQVTLSWTATSGATSYNVYYATLTGVTTASTTKATGLTATAYTIPGLSNGTPYFFVVSAVNSGGESAPSTQVTATPVAPAPVAPAALTANPGNAQVALSWTASSGAATYNLYYSLTSGVTAANGVKISGLATTVYTQTGLTNGSTYYYVVTAVGPGGESVASAQATAKPVAPVAAAPTALTATPGNAQVALAWTASTGATAYNIYYGTSASLSTTSSTKVGSLSGISYTVAGLTNNTLYYFLVTAVNTGGESLVSILAKATPTNGVTVALAPGTIATGTLQATTTTSLTYNFPATAVTDAATATINSIALTALPTPLPHAATSAPLAVSTAQATDTFVASFSLTLDPSISAFSAPVTLSGNVGSSLALATTLNLAVLNKNAWVDVATLIVGSSGGTLNQNLPSVALPGLLAPGTYVLYQPAPGTSTAVSNLGIALIGDGGFGMSDGSSGLQIVHLYSATGTLLSTPTVTYLDYPGTPYFNSQALSPDGSQGIILDARGSNRSFSNTQTGTPISSTVSGDINAGVAIAMLPTGDEAVVSNNAANQLLILSGNTAGKPVTAATIPILGQRDSLVLSADGKVLLARGNTGLSVFSVTPKPGSNGGTISHEYTQIVDFPNLGSSSYFQDGRSGMAISPTDSSRAVVVQPGFSGGTIQLMTNLTSATPIAGTPVQFPTNSYPYAVSISLDGKLAIFGTLQGLEMYSGVDTGTLTRVGTTYSPLYRFGTLGAIATLGITLDGKYVVAADMTNHSLVVIPFTAAGFAARPASTIGSITVSAPYLQDQLVIH
jgi:fibronectin type 3 domain-containing protein